MGTSTSHSSPDGKRWQALKRQYQRPELDITAIVEKLAYAAGATLKAGLSEPGPAAVLVHVIRFSSWDVWSVREMLGRAGGTGITGQQSIWTELALRALVRAYVQAPAENVSTQRATNFCGALLGESGRYLVGRDIGLAAAHGASVADMLSATEGVAGRLQALAAAPAVRAPVEQGTATILRLPATARKRQLLTAQRTLREATTAACRLCVQQAA